MGRRNVTVKGVSSKNCWWSCIKTQKDFWLSRELRKTSAMSSELGKSKAELAQKHTQQAASAMHFPL